MMTYKPLTIWSFISCFTLLFSCSDDTILDSQISMPNGIWQADSLASFEFEIENTTTSYQIDYNIRYAVDYPYYNIYVKYYLEDSVGNQLSSALQELYLFEKKSGEPVGEGLGDLFDLQGQMIEKQEFEYAGRYLLKVKQFMRTERLFGIFSFGVQIQRLKKEGS